MARGLTLEIPMILSVVAQFLAVLAALWLIWPLRLGPIYYSEQSIVDVDGLSVLPMLFAPPAMILATTVLLYFWAVRRSHKAKWAAWVVSALLLLGILISVRVGVFFLPAAATLLLATILQSGIYRTVHS